MHELVLRAAAEQVEPLSDALMDELGAVSVSVEDADVDSQAEEPLFGEPGLPAPREAWRQSTLRALFENEAEATAAATLLRAQDWAHGLRLQSLSAVPDTDWVRLTQSQFTPIEITPSFWIVPSWHAAPAQARTVIRLDPGLAFGTGTHPTTRMCLRWIAQQAGPWAADAAARVLDYGCGSGILAIAAALHGAREVDAVDIDLAAVQASRANATANGVTLVCGTPELAQGRYALVLANILAKPLTLLAPLLASRVAAGGSLVLAGILERQVDELRDAYAPFILLEVADRDEGWALMVATSVAGEPLR